MRSAKVFFAMALVVVGCMPEPKPIEHAPVRPEVVTSKNEQASAAVPTKMTVVDVPVEAAKVDVKWKGDGGEGSLEALQKAADSSFVQAMQVLRSGNYRFVVNAVDKSGEIVASSENCVGDTADEFRVATVGEKSNAVVLRLCRPEKKVFVKVEIKLGEKAPKAVNP